MIIKNCWHTCPVFSLTVGTLQETDRENHLTALVLVTEVSGWRAGEGGPSGNGHSRRPWPHIGPGDIAQDSWSVMWSHRP